MAELRLLRGEVAEELLLALAPVVGLRRVERLGLRDDLLLFGAEFGEFLLKTLKFFVELLLSGGLHLLLFALLPVAADGGQPGQQAAQPVDRGALVKHHFVEVAGQDITGAVEGGRGLFFERREHLAFERVDGLGGLRRNRAGVSHRLHQRPGGFAEPGDLPLAVVKRAGVVVTEVPEPGGDETARRLLFVEHDKEDLVEPAVALAGSGATQFVERVGDVNGERQSGSGQGIGPEIERRPVHLDRTARREVAQTQPERNRFAEGFAGRSSRIIVTANFGALPFAPGGEGDPAERRVILGGKLQHHGGTGGRFEVPFAVEKAYHRGAVGAALQQVAGGIRVADSVGGVDQRDGERGVAGEREEFAGNHLHPVAGGRPGREADAAPLPEGEFAARLGGTPGFQPEVGGRSRGQLNRFEARRRTDPDAVTARSVAPAFNPVDGVAGDAGELPGGAAVVAGHVETGDAFTRLDPQPQSGAGAAVDQRRRADQHFSAVRDLHIAGLHPEFGPVDRGDLPPRHENPAEGVRGRAGPERGVSGAEQGGREQHPALTAQLRQPGNPELLPLLRRRGGTSGVDPPDRFGQVGAAAELDPVDQRVAGNVKPPFQLERDGAVAPAEEGPKSAAEPPGAADGQREQSRPEQPAQGIAPTEEVVQRRRGERAGDEQRPGTEECRNGRAAEEIAAELNQDCR